MIRFFITANLEPFSISFNNLSPILKYSVNAHKYSYFFMKSYFIKREFCKKFL